MKHAGNISKFSRRTVNCFIGTKPVQIPKTPKKPKNKKKKGKNNKIQQNSSTSSPKIQQLNTHEINITNDEIKNKNEEKIEKTDENGKEIKFQNINNAGAESLKLNEMTSIAESKTLEELLKKPDTTNIDIKQSGLMISETIESGKIKGNGEQTEIIPINVEKSVKIE